jgi:homoserine dehydrogenase
VDRVIRIGMLGCGTVGGGVATILAREADDITARTGARLELTRIAVRDAGRDRGLGLPQEVFTTDALAVVEADDVDIIVEVMGGRSPASGLIRRALELGKPVVTANKELVAHEGPELYAAARAAGVDLSYEAAVAGAIPIIKPMKESLAGDRVRRVVGILNGTTNYILTRMTEEGRTTPRSWPRPRRSGTPKPIRPPTSAVTTPPPSAPSSPPWRSTPRCTPTTCSPRASRR